MLFNSLSAFESFTDDVASAREQLALIDNQESAFCGIAPLVGYFAELHASYAMSNQAGELRARFLDLIGSFRTLPLDDIRQQLAWISTALSDYEAIACFPMNNEDDDEDDEDECDSCWDNIQARQVAQAKLESCEDKNIKLMQTLITISKATSLKKMKRLSRKALEQYGASSNV